jgi:predicted TIM-barrel enzyme
VDGAIVGSYFKTDGVLSNSVDVLRVKSFMQVVRAVRETC